VIDLPGVGAHLMDHPTVDVILEDTSDASLVYLEPRNPVQLLKFAFAVAQYLTTGGGPLSSNWTEAAAFFRSTNAVLFPPSIYPQIAGDPTSGPDASDLELFMTCSWYLDHSRAKLPDVSTLGLHVVLLRPQSLGSITLHSADPFQDPAIDPKDVSVFTTTR